jgi:hypothetical protein
MGAQAGLARCRGMHLVAGTRNRAAAGPTRPRRRSQELGSDPSTCTWNSQKHAVRSDASPTESRSPSRWRLAGSICSPAATRRSAPIPACRRQPAKLTQAQLSPARAAPFPVHVRSKTSVRARAFPRQASGAALPSGGPAERPRAHAAGHSG